MKIVKVTPANSLNKAFLKQRPLRSEIELFKNNLSRFLSKFNDVEREENQKNHISDFLKDTYYKDTNEINTKDTIDLVIHLGKANTDPVGVIIEVKRPKNDTEMITENRPNAKALHELVLYYLRERHEKNNLHITRLIATNIRKWFIFDAADFEKHFYSNKSFVKKYEQWCKKQTSAIDTGTFYNEIVKPYIDEIEDEIKCAYFDIMDYESILNNKNNTDDKGLIALQKLLSPYYLIKKQFANDSNSVTYSRG